LRATSHAPWRRPSGRWPVPDNPLQYRWLAASLGKLSRAEEARDALRKAMGLSLDNFAFYAREKPSWFRPQDYALMLDGLRNAGWQG
jgi:adenylate cyclase